MLLGGGGEGLLESEAGGGGGGNIENIYCSGTAENLPEKHAPIKQKQIFATLPETD